MELRTISDVQALNAANSRVGSDDLNQNDFMKLMLAQMKNQDPFEPLDNAEFLGQMAQFSTVTGIGEINQSMSSLADSLTSSQMLNAATLVDRSALVASNSLPFDGQSDIAGRLELPSSSSSVQVEILRPNGETARLLQLGPQTAGAVSYQWDGRDASGTIVPPGNYKVRASYFDGEGQAGLSNLVQAKINSVSLQSGGGNAEVELEGLGSFKLSDVKSISQ
ncbi:MAG: flagellar basal-body rod modification protein FlgD [Bermanella sp.]|jgi:flagellar basal-body rod modification protein FlgD